MHGILKQLLFAVLSVTFCWALEDSGPEPAVIALTPSQTGLLRYRTTWFASTFPATGRLVKTGTHGDHAAWTDLRHVQNTVSAIHVTPDGTIFCIGETEQGPEVAMYRHGEPVGQFFIGHRSHASSVVADDAYVFIANVHTLSVAGRNRFGKPHHPPQGKQWSEVQRYSRTTLMPEPFEGASGVYAATLVLDESERPRAGALALVGDSLFVADPARNRVRVFDRHTLQPSGVHEFACEGPEALAAVGDSALWIIESMADGRRRVAQFGVDGLRRLHPITDIDFPTALAVTPDGRLLVCDDGPAQQVLGYAFRGNVQPERIAAVPMPGTLRGLSGIGVDQTGTAYVGAEEAGARWKTHNILGGVLAAFDPGWNRLWQLEGLVFCDIPAPLAEPDSDRITVYLPTEKLTLDLSAPAGSNWHFDGVTVDPFRFPDDPRLKQTWQSQSVWARSLHGDTYLFIHGMDARAMLQVYRMEGEIAVPHALFLSNGDGAWPPHAPGTGELLWVDANGNGQFDADEFDQRSFPYADPEKRGGATPRKWSVHIDEDGGIWQAHDTSASVSYFPATIKDGHVRYGYDTARVWPVRNLDPRLNWPCNPHYDARTDRLLLLARNHPDGPGTGGGNRLVRFDGWLASDGTAVPVWVRELPFDDAQSGRDRHRKADVSKTFTAAGEYIFVGANAGSRSLIRVYRVEDGVQVGEIGESHQLVPERFASLGAGLGIIDGTDHLRAFRRSDGEYLVFRGDNNHGKAVLYRWHPERGVPYGPDGMRAQPRTDGAVDLTWRAPELATAYRVERCVWTLERGWGAWDVLAAQHPAADFTDVGLEPNRRYRYRVQSVGAHGLGGYSSTVQAQPWGPIGLAGWQAHDIGAVDENGSSVWDAARHILTLHGASSTDIARGGSAYHFCGRSRVGDGELIVRLLERSGSGREAFAGIMVREGLDPKARFVRLIIGSNGDIIFGHSGEDGPPHAGLQQPVWLRVRRQKDLFEAWVARSPETWTLVGTLNVALPAEALWGVCATSGLGEGVLSEVRYLLDE